MDPESRPAPISPLIQPPQSNSLDPISILKYAFWLFWRLLRTAVRGIASWMVACLSQTFSITLKMSTIVFIVLLGAAAVWTLVRYRLLTKYSRLPSDESDAEEDELWLDDQPAQPSSYFDEFLNAIKVFGYIDRKVFDELTRHMRTYRIDAGETVHLRDLDGFAVVMDGSMQLYTAGKGKNQYQLLNEVNKAGPLSSLFTILGLLTAQVQIDKKFQNFDVPPMDLNDETSSFDDNDGEETTTTPLETSLDTLVFAVAKKSTRIAVIPASTFSLLARKYPIQTANIIQVILLRWYQVAVNSCGNFFDLIDLVVQAEIKLNERSQTRIPAWIKESTVKRLKHMALEDPECNSFTLKPRKQVKHGPTIANGRGVHHVSVEVDTSYPGDLVSNVPILSRSNSVFDQQELAAAFNAAAQNTGARDDSEDAISRKVLVEEIFKLMGLDGNLVTKPNKRDSLVISAPNSPLLGQHRQVPFLNPDLTGTKSTDTSSISAPEPTGVSYEELVDLAANLVQVMMYRKDSVLGKENEKCTGLFYVIDGTLGVYSHGKHLYNVQQGQVAGYLDTIASQLSYFEIRASTDVVVARLPKKAFEGLGDKYPLIYLSTGKVVGQLLDRDMLLLNYALEWVHCRAGETLFREGAQADAIYYVVSGRIRGYINRQDGRKPDLKGEYGQGSYLGQLETLVEEQYSSSGVAIRETEVARIPRTLIEYLAQEYPEMPFKMTKLVAREVKRRENKEKRAALASLASGQDFATLAILPVSQDLPVHDFAQKLVGAFKRNCRDCVMLNRNGILDYLGKYAFSGLGSLKLKTHLAGLEQQHETLVYVADDSNVSSQWTQTCIDQADCVLLLADANAAPTFSDYERMLMRSKIHHNCHLILLHNDETVKPGVTSAWLKKRTWVSAHHHIQLDFDSKPVENPRQHNGKRGLQTLKEIKDRIKHEFQDQRSSRPPAAVKSQHNHYRFKNDFQRLARILSGEAVGLVLGGGGARGISHIGVIKALEEKGIPIDMVGGTSIGSFVGGLYASDYDTLSVYRRAKKFSGRFASIWHILMDLTYPATSYTTGHAFNRGIWKAFGNSRIEDFWLRYFNNTTNITHSRMEVHKSGYAWRYIRASMSLAGLVPPIEDKGEMLLDGGYMDNLPVEEMRRLGAKYIIAVDVGSVDDTTPMAYGDSLSGLWVLFNRYNPFSAHPNIPNIAEIQARLAYVSSVKPLDDAKSAAGVVYLRPPIDLYATLDFGKFDEILSVGYTYAIRKLRELEETGELGQIAGIKDEKDRWVPELERRHSF